ncbi:hypothetical protein P154DRAFT_524602 [Amniculicola lignicola CBS 123094]|uniref:SART-1 protein n=1 Tax=Amniculicola lignicola CBS 123094 TaxID=1392246 RepID=A0A6A5WAD0_9PLEO|nr:hypothetical protein P154DRAFT_524602 [Amniculicola lignicola CBS 123094]
MDLSIEEANKIRASLGVAPLGGGPAPAGPAFKADKQGGDSDDEPASTIDTRTAASYDNWEKHQAEVKAHQARDARNAAIKKSIALEARNQQLEGKTLADVDDEDDRAWLKGSKKRQGKITKTMQAQLDKEERDRKAKESLQYTEADLAGVKVGHSMNDFEDEDQILVLKDAAVDADEDDELEGIDLREKERLQEKEDSKKRKRAYDPHDFSVETKSSILSQYDDEINGKKRKTFTLDGQGRTLEDADMEDEDAMKPKKVSIGLDFLQALQDETPANDYMEVSEVRIKKPKKKKSKATRRKYTEDPDAVFPMPDEDVAMEDVVNSEANDGTSVPKKNKKYDISFVEDDDLEKALAAQRQRVLRKRNNPRKTLLERIPTTPDTPIADEDVGMIIDATTEFVNNFVILPEEEKDNGSKTVPGGLTPVPEAKADVVMSVESGESGLWYNEEKPEEVKSESAESRERSISVAGGGLEFGEEATVDRGLGATLNLLRDRGIVERTDSSDKTASWRQKQMFIAQKQKLAEMSDRVAREARERDRASGRYNTMTAKEREERAQRDNKNREAHDARAVANMFNKEYKPSFEITHVDEHGRIMSKKEAFKELSHAFHGKGSGNNKTQKHLDKIASEKKKMAENSLETVRRGGLGNAHGQQAAKVGQPGVRLQ